MPEPKRPRLPTLKKLTGERPCCQYCGDELRPRCEIFEVVGHLTAIPTSAALLEMEQPKPAYPTIEDAFERGYRPSRVFRLHRRLDYIGRQFTTISFWTGKYQGAIRN